MTIPESKLVLKLDVTHLTLGDAAVFDGRIDPMKFRKFLLKYGSWSEAEVDEIEFGELAEVAEQVMAEVRAVSLPLGSEPRSGNGHGSNGKRRRRGSAQSSTPKSSTAIPRMSPIT